MNNCGYLYSLDSSHYTDVVRQDFIKDSSRTPPALNTNFSILRTSMIPYIIMILLLIFLFSSSPAFAEMSKEIMLKRLVKMLNDVRIKGSKCGDRFYPAASPLRGDNRLTRSAHIHALDMAQRNRLSHRGRDGSNAGERIKAAGYKWKAFGENIGEGYNKPDDILKAWLESEDHCKNIMNPDFRDIGVAVAKKNGKAFWVLVLALSD